MSPLARLVTLACVASPVAACAPVDLQEDRVNINDEVSNDGRVGFYLIRDDLRLSPGANYGSPHSYFLTIDGTYATWNMSTYARFNPDEYVHMPVRSGVHALGIVDDATKVATTIPAVESRPHPDPTPGIVDDYGYYMGVVFFGGAAGMNSRVFVNDPAAVPAGTIHVRVMNALSDHQPLQMVQCPASFEGDWTYKASDCAPVDAPIAYGDVYEADATPDVVAKLGFHWAPPGASSSAVTPINRSGVGASGAFITHIPAELAGSAAACPSCLFIDL